MYRTSPVDMPYCTRENRSVPTNDWGSIMSTVETILADAAQLPAEQRLDLIEALWETLPESDRPPLSDEWRAEITRRSAEYDAGKASTIAWEDIKRDARSRLDRGDR